MRFENGLQSLYSALDNLSKIVGEGFKEYTCSSRSAELKGWRLNAPGVSRSPPKRLPTSVNDSVLL